MKSRLQAERPEISWWAEPNDLDHWKVPEFPSWPDLFMLYIHSRVSVKYKCVPVVLLSWACVFWLQDPGALCAGPNPWCQSDSGVHRAAETWRRVWIRGLHQIWPASVRHRSSHQQSHISTRALQVSSARAHKCKWINITHTIQPRASESNQKLFSCALWCPDTGKTFGLRRMALVCKCMCLCSCGFHLALSEIVFHYCLTPLPTFRTPECHWQWWKHGSIQY